MNIKTFKKRLLSAVVAVSAAFGMLMSSSFAANIDDTFETAKSATGKILLGWNLGNTLDPVGDWINANNVANFETAWGNPKANESMIKAIKAAGFNAIRVPVSFSRRMDDKGNVKKEWLDRVEEVVNYVLKNDLYCIINIHHDTGESGWLRASRKDYDAMSAKFMNIWVQLSERFNKYGELLMFESMNEILDDNNSWTQSNQAAYDVVNDLNQIFVDTVRASGGNNANRNLILATYSASGYKHTLDGFKLPKDTAENHLVVEIHNYDPFNFTHTKTNNSGITQWGTASEKQHFDNYFSTVNSFQEKHGVPVIVGEFGSQNNSNTDSRALHAGYFVKAAAKYGIKCFYWDNGNHDEFAILDRYKYTITEPKIVKAMLDNAVSSGETIQNTAPAEEAKETIKTIASPENIKAEKINNSIKLTWNAVDNAYGYRIYKYDSESKKYIQVKSTKKSEITFKKQASGTHIYKIAAIEKTEGKFIRGKLSKAVTVKV